MAPPKKERGRDKYHWGEQLRDDLVKEALQQVEPFGIASLSAREVARAVGVSHAAPGHYFPDRLSFAAAIATAGYEQLYAEITKAVEGSRNRPVDRLLAACTAYVEFALEKPGLYRSMYAPELIEGQSRSSRSREKREDPFANLLEIKGRTFAVFVEIVREGQGAGVFRKGKADDLARLATAAAHGLARQFIDEGLGARIDRLAHARQVFTLMLGGLEVR
jgi:AcrR family transcriptional regulator